MWSTRRVTIKHKSPKKNYNHNKKKKRSEQWEFIIIYNSWSLCSYSFQVQVSGKQNRLTEWQNKHRTVERRLIPALLLLLWFCASAPKHMSDNLIIPLGEDTMYVNLSRGRRHTSVIAVIAHSPGPNSLSCKSGLRRKAVILPVSLKESHRSAGAALPVCLVQFIQESRLDYHRSRIIYLRLAFV